MTKPERLQPFLDQRPISQLKIDPRNPRTHSDAQIEQIRRSIAEFGFINPILIDSENRIVAGHGRLRAANLAGLEAVPVLVLGLGHLTESQRRAFQIADNQIPLGAGWDEALLRSELEALKLDDFDLSLLAFDPGELVGMLDEEPAPTKRAKVVADTDEDAEPPPMDASAAAPWVEDGKLYQLGVHRLFVGDSLLAESRERLIGKGTIDAVLTDPPYAIYGSSSGISSSIADDKMVLPFFETFFRAVADHLKEFGHIYSFCDWRSVGAIYTALGRVPALTLKNKLIWDKGGSGLGSNWSNTHEEIIFAHRLQPKRVMKGADGRPGIRIVNKPNVLRANRPSGAERLHNAAKPVGLLSELIEASTDKGEKIWEPFAGSGSTLIACEKTGRVCLAGEANAINAQITIERWQRITGGTATEVE